MSITVDLDNKLTPLFKTLNNMKEPYNQCRQMLPQTYLHNGYIDILKTSILEQNTISGSKIYPYIMNDNCVMDIDTNKDFVKAEMYFNNLI
jgi:CMP-N-acetylneuraminic acid synthetase